MDQLSRNEAILLRLIAGRPLKSSEINLLKNLTSEVKKDLIQSLLDKDLIRIDGMASDNLENNISNRIYKTTVSAIGYIGYN